MAEKIKKYAIVIFLTFLVWAWAFNKLERIYTHSATLTITENTNSDILVTFDKQVPIDMSLQFKGTQDKIDDLKTRIDTGLEDLVFKFNPESGKKTSGYTLNVLDFLNKSSKVRKRELEVVSSTVELLQVQVDNLVKKTLKIKCIDENGGEIIADRIEPPTVDIYVKDEYTGDATVILSDRDIAAASKNHIVRIPFVQVSPTEKRKGRPVEIKLPSIELPTDTVQTTNIGYSLGKTLVGRYKIVLKNEDKLISSVTLRGTPEALDTYRNQDIHIFVVALDGDEKKQEDIVRPVVFNFNPKDVANGHIRLAKDEPDKAVFRLVKLPQTPGESPPR